MKRLFERYRCRRVMRMVSAGMDEPLTPRQRRTTEAHLARCAGCRTEAALYRELKEAAAGMDYAPVPPHIWERIELTIAEHPWGEGTGARSKIGWGTVIGRIMFGQWRPAGVAMAGLITVLAILMPSQIPHESQARPLTFVEAERTSAAYLSFLLAMEGDRFPAEVQDFYLNQLGALDQRIRTVESAMRRFPGNHAIRQQLIAAYQQKITLYKRLQTVHYGIDRGIPGGDEPWPEGRGFYE
ncbi:MAG: hypothetical protein GYA46_07610 [candidate division Zixibacteria bacterium]|nr:hypothetical protein [candidate division Zixibacteria bacterium]